MARPLARQLRKLGLSKGEVGVYTQLLASGPAPISDIAKAVERDEEWVRESVDGLGRLGLVGHSGDDAALITPVSPIAALDLLARRRESEIREAQVHAMQAYETFRRTVWPHQTHGLIEVVTGPEMLERITMMEQNVTREVLRMDSPPYFMPGVNQAELDNLARGVQYRVVYSRSSVEWPGFYDENIRPSIAHGEQARTLPSLPVKLSIYDERVALVALSITEAEVNPSFIVVNPSPLLSALHGLFELTWRAALPMHVGDRQPSPLRPVERQVLELLAIGLADEVIAERVGVSRRTLTRHIERLMTRAGVASRFQLGLYASRHGWL